MFSASPSPGVQSYSSSSSSSPFQRLKPACVELLTIGAKARFDKNQTDRANACLRRLCTTLEGLVRSVSDSDHVQDAALREPVLAPSLVHYVFFPISQLISTSPKGLATLPDSITEALFQVLTLLAEQWWYTWQTSANAAEKEWGVWRDLLILGASVLGDPGKTASSLTSTASDETKAAATSFLIELLKPRHVHTLSQAPSDLRDWEWDGVSDLPSLDDLDVAEPGKESSQEPELAYPSVQHLEYASKDRISKGALSFCLSSAFTLADDADRPTQLRTSALELARHALLQWIGGLCTAASGGDASTFCKPIRPEDKPLQVAERLRPLLPGIASSLTRLATSKSKPNPASTQSTPGRNTPGPVASKAIDLLRDLLRTTLSDESLQSVMASARPVLQEIPSRGDQTPVVLTKLEDFAEIVDDEGDSTASRDGPELKETSSSSQRSPLPDRWALSSLAQAKLALKSFAPLTSSLVAGSTLPSSLQSAVQKSLVDLAGALIFSCGGAFEWLDTQLRSIPQMDTSKSCSTADDETTTQMLFLWILDLSAQDNTAPVSSHARTVLNTLWRSSASQIQVLQSVISNALNQLPDAIKDREDATVSRLATRLSTIFELLTQPGSKFSAAKDSLIAVGTQTSSQWSRNLVRVLKVDNLTYATGSADANEWKLVPRFAGLETSTAQQLSTMFFLLGQFAALATIDRLDTDVAAERIKTGDGVLDIIVTFVEEASALRSLHVSSSSMLDQEQSLVSLAIAAEMLRGASSKLDNIELSFSRRGAEGSKAVRRTAHRLARKVFALVIECFDSDTVESLSTAQSLESSRSRQDVAMSNFLRKSSEVSSQSAEPDDTRLVERIKGLSIASDASSRPDNFGPALDLSYLSAASVTGNGNVQAPRKSPAQQYLHAQRSTEYANAFLFALMGSCSKIMGQTFRPLMLQASYPLISGMSSSSSALLDDVMRSASVAVFNEISHNAAYASPKNCMMDQADYVLGGACQRLISGLEEELVLFTTNRGTPLPPAGPSTSAKAEGQLTVKGGEAMLLPLTSAQRAPFVLVEMIRMLGSEIVPMVQDAIDEILDALDRFHAHLYVADGLLAVLGSILETMAGEQTSQVPGKAVFLSSQAAVATHRTEVAQLKDWLDERKRRNAGVHLEASNDVSGEPDPASQTSPSDEKKKPPHTATQILLKAVPFLTHSSPELRCRVLDLLRHGIETLAPQGRLEDLLPVINSAWPFVMSRLGQAYASTSSGSHAMPQIIDLSKQRRTAHFTPDERNWAEQNPHVWIAASRFTATAAQHISDFVGRRIVQEAWPRFRSILHLLKTKYDPRADVAAHSKSIQSSSFLDSDVAQSGSKVGLISEVSKTRSFSKDTASRPGPFIIQSPTSQPAELMLSIVCTLTATITHSGSIVSDEVAWEVSTHPILLGLLDDRQPLNVQTAAGQLYTSLARRNGDATWYVLRGAYGLGEKSGRAAELSALPYFLRLHGAHVHAEALHRILSI